MTIQTITTPTAEARKRVASAKQAAKIEEVVRRVRAGEFGTQNAVADAFHVDHGTITRWRDRAFIRGLIKPREWDRALLQGKLRALDNEH